MEAYIEAEDIAIGIDERFVVMESYRIIIGVPVAVEANGEIVGQKIHPLETHHCIGVAEGTKSRLIEEGQFGE